MQITCPRCGVLHPSSLPCLSRIAQDTGARGLMPGTVLAGRYHVVRTIHQGGMSTVYLAEDMLLHGRSIALKELRPEEHATVDEVREAEAWFARESALLSVLRHPLIPAFYSVFREGGRSYIAQEYVPGENLDELVRRQGPVAPLRASAWALALCSLLQYLHTLPEPVIFRDLKPANILLRAGNVEAELAVVDFGIARPFHRDTVGTVIGTPGYAPPEQYQGLATPQSDVYALGATLHRLLTAYDPEQDRPFSFPSVRTLNPAVPAALAGVVERATALNPAERYRSVAEMAMALRPLAPQPARLAGSVAASRGVVRGLAALATLLLVPLVLSQMLFQSSSSFTFQSKSTELQPLYSSQPQWSSIQDEQQAIASPCTTRIQPSPTITCGPDGSVWYVDPHASAVDRVAPKGVLSRFALPRTYGPISTIAADPDGSGVWLAGAQDVARLSVDGRFTRLNMPEKGGAVSAIAAGPNEMLWFIRQQSDTIGRRTADGTVTVFPLASGVHPGAITAGPDGNLWFIEEGINAIGQMSPTGSYHDVVLPAGSTPTGLAKAPDGAIWWSGARSMGVIKAGGHMRSGNLPRHP